MNSKKPITMAAAVCGATLLLAACGGGGPSSSGESKLTDGKVVIGLLNDQSGVYKDLSGPNSKVAIEMAIDLAASGRFAGVNLSGSTAAADPWERARVTGELARRVLDAWR